jgi:hypothetical protein
MLLEAYTATAEGDAFHFETEPLLVGVFSRSSDLASRADYAMPRQIAKRPKSARRLARSVRKSRGGGDLPVRSDLAAWDAPY